MGTDRKIIRRCLYFFMLALSFSGVTAIPIRAEINFLSKWTEDINFIQPWMQQLKTGIDETVDKYPFLFYGYDWLAFAHIVLAILFIGPMKDPVRNKWVVEFGIIACLLIIPYACIAGHFRGIPFWWRLIDCSFGIIGIIPLAIAYKKINHIEHLETKNIEYENSLSY